MDLLRGHLQKEDPLPAIALLLLRERNHRSILQLGGALDVTVGVELTIFRGVGVAAAAAAATAGAVGSALISGKFSDAQGLMGQAEAHDMKQCY